LRTSLIVLLLISAAGCATIDYDYPKQESHFLPDTSETRLGNLVEPEVARQPAGQSGFFPMNDGVDALAARLLLAERTEKSIDVQYYLIKNDVVGRVFVYTLLQAADRGVRVRLLVDDMFTNGYDVGLAALQSHPNFEIRIFNPFHRGTAGRAKSALTGFGRINRRMHNKSFTADNQITIIGGRNIADEYFGLREDAKFGDLDVMGVGPVVQDVSNMFDTYWNHEAALPVLAFVDELDDPEAALNELREKLGRSLEEVRNSEYAGAAGQRYEQFLESKMGLFEWAPYKLVVDSPDKGIKAKAEEAESITAPLIESLRSAERELLIVSPYFVPTKRGVESLSNLQKRGIEVTVITNSLAVAGTEFIDASGATATLHTKAFIVDDKEVFIGSFNFDPRSANLNTELGVIIYDPELALLYSVAVDEHLRDQTYEVYLNEDGKLRWRGYEDGQEVIYDKEPETTWGQRFMAGFARIIPQSQL
jgi:putative cardiolipin synthase